jgi:hypothetical protein
MVCEGHGGKFAQVSFGSFLPFIYRGSVYSGGSVGRKTPLDSAQLYDSLTGSHLLNRYSLLIRIGAYRRLPEFKNAQCLLSKMQKQRLREALGVNLRNEAYRAIAMMGQRLVEHELTLVRAPTALQIIEEVRQICLQASECLTLLKSLQSKFNTEDQRLAPPKYNLQEATKGISGPPNARTAAIDLIKRKLSEPIPAFLALGPLIEACREIRDDFSAKRGPKSDTYLTLYFVTLTNSALLSGASPTLPSNDAFSKNGTRTTTRFFDFVRVALEVAEEIAEELLIHRSISKAEKISTLWILKKYRSLSNGQLLGRLRPVKGRKLPGLVEMLNASTAIAGSTRGRPSKAK